jgi:methylated-DNA-protein-cysteine methyltransferase-like protein
MTGRHPRQVRSEKSHVPARAADGPWRAIYAVVRSIPRGRVATYGEVAELAGFPSGHRVVARAMRSCPESLPWQRVIGKKDARRGQINIDEPEHAALQHALLEAEAVVFDANGFVSLRHSSWSLDSSIALEKKTSPRRKKKAPSQRKPGKRTIDTKRR